MFRELFSVAGSCSLRVRSALGVLVLLGGSLASSAGCSSGRAQKPAKSSSPQAQASSAANAEQENRKRLEATFAREAFDQLKPFPLEVPGIKAEALTAGQPKFEQLREDTWSIVAKLAKDVSPVECALMNFIEPLGFVSGRFINVSLVGNDKVDAPEVVAADVLERQSKYPVLEQLVRYRVAEREGVIGTLHLMSTHGDGWTLTCAVDAPGFFKTFQKSVLHLANSIEFTDDTVIRPKEYSFHKSSVGVGDKAGLFSFQEFFEYDVDKMVVQESILTTLPTQGGKSQWVKSQHEVLRYRKSKLVSGLVLHEDGGTITAEYSLAPGKTAKQIVVRNLKEEDGKELVAQLEAPLWSQTRLKACLRKLFGKKRRTRSCDFSTAQINQGQLAFPATQIKVDDRAQRIAKFSMSGIEFRSWYDEKFDQERSTATLKVQDKDLQLSVTRVWPQPEARPAR